MLQFNTFEKGQRALDWSLPIHHLALRSFLCHIMTNKKNKKTEQKKNNSQKEQKQKQNKTKQKKNKQKNKQKKQKKTNKKTMESQWGHL